MFEPKVRNEQTDLLVEAILKLQSKEDAYRFFEDVCTIAEMKSMAQRIAKETGASSATISRVNRALIYGADGYRRVLDALEDVSAKE